MKIALLTVEKLKLQVAYLRRMKYGPGEQLEHAQLELVGGQIAQPALTPTQAEGAEEDEHHSNVTSTGSQEASGTRAHRNA